MRVTTAFFLLAICSCGNGPRADQDYLLVTINPPASTALDVAMGQVQIQAVYASASGMSQNVTFRLPSQKQALHFPTDFTIDSATWGDSSLDLCVTVLDENDAAVACGKNTGVDVEPAVFKTDCANGVCQGMAGVVLMVPPSFGCPTCP